jgi:hypothetical protein
MIDYPEVIYVWVEEVDTIYRAVKDLKAPYKNMHQSKDYVFITHFDGAIGYYLETEDGYVTVYFQTSLEDCLKYREEVLQERLEAIKVQLDSPPSVME